MIRHNAKKVLVIGSGPIVIGQAAEFDYAGTQACRSLREEGIKVVLVNSNPSTIMTDSDIADAVYTDYASVCYGSYKKRETGCIACHFRGTGWTKYGGTAF